MEFNDRGLQIFHNGLHDIQFLSGISEITSTALSSHRHHIFNSSHTVRDSFQSIHRLSEFCELLLLDMTFVTRPSSVTPNHDSHNSPGSYNLGDQLASRLSPTSSGADAAAHELAVHGKVVDPAMGAVGRRLGGVEGLNDAEENEGQDHGERRHFEQSQIYESPGRGLVRTLYLSGREVFREIQRANAWTDAMAQTRPKAA